MNAGNTSGGGVVSSGRGPVLCSSQPTEGRMQPNASELASSVVLHSLLFCVFAAKRQQLHFRYEKNKLLLKVTNRQTSSIRSSEASSPEPASTGCFSSGAAGLLEGGSFLTPAPTPHRYFLLMLLLLNCLKGKKIRASPRRVELSADWLG